jgi:hypothetical protein
MLLAATAGTPGNACLVQEDCAGGYKRQDIDGLFHCFAMLLRDF